ncbi:HindIII family type II restriction endonuclease [Adlercreutzia sp. ZJ242]|uniref:HindIII family type II restriction endonuclease n=1 Tax=Adlercreutzia sp. ZJ242 TaxID=2709409 RepID=UPI0013EAB565|nr:HindIII family type II restriction endonuclease [Adlercreutzia sp. ZJ242]
MINYAYLQLKVDEAFAGNKTVNHELLANRLHSELGSLPDDDFEHLLTTAGFIPDVYENDSSEETLFTKFIEALVCTWANRIGLDASMVKTKGSREDVTIEVDDKIIVCDAKSFRLGRSQKAPNAKDFLKLEDVRKWMEYHGNAIGGLVTYPCKHEWTTSSDIYQYCSTKEVPTVMLPYKILAFLFHYRNQYKPTDLLRLWDYGELFPEKLLKRMKGGNKSVYWAAINRALLEITHQSQETLQEFIVNADATIDKTVIDRIEAMQKEVKAIEDRVRARIEELADEDVRSELIKYMSDNETASYRTLIQRIKCFRL